MVPVAGDSVFHAAVQTITSPGAGGGMVLAMAGKVISFQLYSARKFPPLERQLEALAAAGYQAVEPYGDNYLADPAAFRQMAEASGLKCASAHMPVALLEADAGRFAEVAGALGTKVAILPYLDAPARPTTADGWKALGEKFGAHAARLAAKGLALAWHNHDFEYQPLPDGSRPIDHLLAAPEMRFEADLGWMVRAGVDVAAEMARYGGRLVAVHMKDLAPEGVTADDGWTDVGSGTIDWKALWPAIAATGVGLFVVEHDNPSNLPAFVTNSYRFVSSLVGQG